MFSRNPSSKFAQPVASHPLAVMALIAGVIVAVLFACASPVLAQAPATQPETPSQRAAKTSGFTLYEKFEGSSSSDGWVMDLNSTTGYDFNKYFGVYAGMPFYFVRTSSTVSTSSPSGVTGSGIGNFYAGAKLSLDNPIANYGTSFTGTAPTGDTSKGHSTGHFTYNWDNSFDHSFGRITPSVSVGIGNTVQDTVFFKRPFTTYGHVANFEGGLSLDVWKSLSLNASLYDVLPWGPQTVISRVVRTKGSSGSSGGRHDFERQTIVVGGADLARDNGYNVGLSFNPTRFMDVSVGYSHSVPLKLDTVSFGIGFNISNMFKRPPSP